jgi:hypothetical protein
MRKHEVVKTVEKTPQEFNMDNPVLRYACTGLKTKAQKQSCFGTKAKLLWHESKAALTQKQSCFDTKARLL